MHPGVSPTEMNGAAAFMGETQNGLVSQEGKHSGKQEGQDKSRILENSLGEPVGDVLHIGAPSGPDP